MKLDDLQNKASLVLITDGDKILSFRAIYRPGLSLPGGKVDLGETFEQAAIRECKEETGLDVKLHDNPFIGIEDSNNTVVATFRAEITGGELIDYCPGEGYASWVTVEELVDDAAFPSYTNRLLNYFNLSL